jgi:hypothetical protein
VRRDWTRTIFLRGPDEDYTMSTKGRMLERMRVILAGRAAEEVSLCALALRRGSPLALTALVNFLKCPAGMAVRA